MIYQLATNICSMKYTKIYCCDNNNLQGLVALNIAMANRIEETQLFVVRCHDKTCPLIIRQNVKKDYQKVRKLQNIIFLISGRVCTRF